MSHDWRRRALEIGTMAAVLWEGVPDATGQVSNMRCVESTSGFDTWVGREKQDVVGALYSELIPSGVHDRLPVYLESMRLQSPRTLRFHPVPVPGRTATTIELRMIPCGENLLYVQDYDVSEEERRIVEAEGARHAAEEGLARIEAAVNASPVTFALYQAQRDDAGSVRAITILFVNDAAAAPTGRSADSWQGADLLDWFPEAKATGLFDRIVEALDRHVPLDFIVTTDSTRGWLGSFQNHIAPFGPDIALITWAPRSDESIGSAGDSLLASRDSLTGALTRGAFLARASSELVAFSEHGFALLVLDLDDFGALNDLIGEHRADAVLAELATGLLSLRPRPELLGRIGPDEFAMVMHCDADNSNPQACFERMSEVLARVAAGVSVPRLHASAGWVRLDGERTIQEALRDCDTALRASVEAGGGRLTEFTPALRDELLRRGQLDEAMLSGISRGEFQLAYQPIVRIESGAAWGAEALVRWHHPVFGLMYPGKFIASAEASGVIVDLGTWVMRSAIEHLGSSTSLAHLTVNVTSHQLIDGGLPETVGSALELRGVDPSRLLVEITESAFLPDSGRIRSELRELQALGVRVALDDFGSGYSSIAYLDRIPFDIVKLDGYFLHGTLDRRRRDLIAATASMVRILGGISLVEHIETNEQLEIVREAGVDLGQGFLFGRPEFPDSASGPA